MGRWGKFGGDTESKCGACANENDDEERVVCCLFFFFQIDRGDSTANTKPPRRLSRILRAAELFLKKIERTLVFR